MLQVTLEEIHTNFCILQTPQEIYVDMTLDIS